MLPLLPLLLLFPMLTTMMMKIRWVGVGDVEDEDESKDADEDEDIDYRF